ncbi:MAG: hypothetical protein CMQ13_04920 [Gammaproteobacteria bacterium]|nr:hypothetical protein [Gammaproteobacteria bacterium]
MEQGLGVSVRKGELENLEFNQDRGFGITLYVGKRKGSASTTDSSEAAIRETVAAAKGIAKHTEEDPYSGLAEAGPGGRPPHPQRAARAPVLPPVGRPRLRHPHGPRHRGQRRVAGQGHDDRDRQGLLGGQGVPLRRGRQQRAADAGRGGARGGGLRRPLRGPLQAHRRLVHQGGR